MQIIIMAMIMILDQMMIYIVKKIENYFINVIY
jgi:hypothetical protein